MALVIKGLLFGKQVTVHTEVDACCDALCETVSVYHSQYFPVCGLKKASRLPLVNISDCPGGHRFMLDKGLILWQKVNQVVIKMGL